MTLFENRTDGARAFGVAIAASMLQALTFGISNSYSIFGARMAADERLGKPSQTEISLPSSVSTGLGPIISLLAGVLVSRFGTRVASLVSAVALGLSVLVSALAANSIATLVVTYGVLMAVSVAFMISPGATATSTWFVKRKALGMGICFSGGGVGNVIIPRIAGALAERYDWRASFMILSSLSILSILVALCVCMRYEQKEAGTALATTTAATEEGEGEGNPPINGAVCAELGGVQAPADSTTAALTEVGDPAVETSVETEEPVTSVGTAVADGTPESALPPSANLAEEGDGATPGPVRGRRQSLVIMAAAGTCVDASFLAPPVPSPPPSALCADLPPRPFCLHTDRATGRQLLCEVFLSRAFVGLCLSYIFLSTGFYAQLYVSIPYAFEMGRNGTVYASAPALSVSDATSVYIPYGAMQVVAGPMLGYIAARYGERLVSIASLLVMSLSLGCYALCRLLWEHMLVMAVIGPSVSGYFLTYGAMVGQHFYGPNLPVVMSCAFAVGAIGGFAGAPIATALIEGADGRDYTATMGFMAAMCGASAFCVLFIVPPPPPPPLVETIGNGNEPITSE